LALEPLTPSNNRTVVICKAAAEHLQRITKAEKDLSDAETEAEVLKAIVNQKCQLHRKQAWLLSEGGLEDVIDDFNLLLDSFSGDRSKDLAKPIDLVGELFLTPKEKEEYELHRRMNDPQASHQWLVEHTTPRLRKLWFFYIFICRLLQRADRWLTPYDAYWLGLVHEVVGTNLPNLRILYENLPAKQPEVEG
jgi:hypothetical protein